MTRMGNRKFIWPFVLAFALIVFYIMLMPRAIDWSPSFSLRHKTPYGNYILHARLPDLFSNQPIRVSSSPIYNTLSEDSTLSANYLFIDTAFQPDQLDSEKLLEFVGRGNHAFIAAQQFSGPLADSLSIDTGVDIGIRDSLTLYFNDAALDSGTGYVFRRGVAEFYFSRVDSSRIAVLGRNSRGRTDFIRLTWGEGAFFISSTPFAFTNYNMLFRDNRNYISKALSYLPVRETVWDEYYKKVNRAARSPLRFVMHSPALRWAYFTGISALMLFVIFQARRRQAIIPIIKPIINTTLEFVDTLGRLYFQAGDHKNLAEKKITYLLEFIRNRFQLKTNELTNEFCSQLAKKSTLAISDIRKLFDSIQKVQTKTQIDETELSDLNNQIERFYQTACLDGSVR